MTQPRVEIGSQPEVRVRAPGKVNLGLRVGAREPDGYHPLVTVFQAVSVYEDVVATPGDGLTLSVSGPQAHLVPTDDTNLALRAARALAEFAGIDEGVHLHIELPLIHIRRCLLPSACVAPPVAPGRRAPGLARGGGAGEVGRRGRGGGPAQRGVGAGGGGDGGRVGGRGGGAARLRRVLGRRAEP
ncbi:hypothetical protein [Cellulomonas timonensis]|uniref:hypothetical protein n=1 Tax=Cellulomonas timonensis TaxID=1689271 RepID=UPI000ACA7225|nr:hypothetical protein [Cellulomonas timonensis]